MNTREIDNPSVAALNADEDSFFGLKFPLGYGAGTEGFFPRSSTIKEQASSNIKNLLLTQIGERAGQPTFGSNLPRIIFEPLEIDVLKESITQTIEEALERWLPYITVHNVGTYQDKNNPNTVVVQLEFTVDVEDPEAPETLTFTFNTGG
jgi:phage baseplate assembly protein W